VPWSTWPAALWSRLTGISTRSPGGPAKCLNVIEFYYPEEIALFEPEFMAAETRTGNAVYNPQGDRLGDILSARKK